MNEKIEKEREKDNNLLLDHRFTDPRLADRQLEREFNR
eukprot:UN4376